MTSSSDRMWYVTVGAAGGVTRRLVQASDAVEVAAKAIVFFRDVEDKSSFEVSYAGNLMGEKLEA